MTDNKKQVIAENARNNAITNNKKFDNMINNIFSEIMTSSKNINKINDNFLSEKDLPKISIVTPTFNRRNMVKLMLLNYNVMDYPNDKKEWIIIDDGDQKILDLLPSEYERCKLNIKYYSLNTRFVRDPFRPRPISSEDVSSEDMSS